MVAAPTPLVPYAYTVMGEVPQKQAQDAASVAAKLSQAGRKEDLLPYLDTMATDDASAEQAAQVIALIASTTPNLLTGNVPRLIPLLYAEREAISTVGATCLEALTKEAPAKVAKHLDKLREGFDRASSTARDGTIRILVGLCRASVVYQHRVIDLLDRALAEVDDHTLVDWARLMLPSLKGEPHFQARERVTSRLATLSSKPAAAELAEFLGVRLGQA